MKIFIQKFTKEKVLNENDVMIIDRNYFLVKKEFKMFFEKKPIYIGEYLGTSWQGFKPGIRLLQLIKEKTNNKVVIGNKQEWLFVCGRDMFKENFVEISGSSEFKIVTNNRGEVLGYGKMEGESLINYFDIGDFYRREREETNEELK